MSRLLWIWSHDQYQLVTNLSNTCLHTFKGSNVDRALLFSACPSVRLSAVVVIIVIIIIIKQYQSVKQFDPVQDRSHVGPDLGRSKLFAKLAGMSIHIHR